MPTKQIVDPSLRAEMENALAEYGPWITYPQAAELTGSSERSLRRETAMGHLPCYQIGRRRVLRLRVTDVFALIVRVR